MSAVFHAVPHRDATSRRARSPVTPLALRVLLLLACVAAMTIAWRFGDPSVALRADPELAQLLRGMAILKGLAVVAAIALLAWRFGQPIAPRVAGAYIASSCLMAASAATIWQLTALLPAAVAFHAGLFVALIVAWRADGDLPIRAKIPG